MGIFGYGRYSTSVERAVGQARHEQSNSQNGRWPTIPSHIVTHTEPHRTAAAAAAAGSSHFSSICEIMLWIIV